MFETLILIPYYIKVKKGFWVTHLDSHTTGKPVKQFEWKNLHKSMQTFSRRCFNWKGLPIYCSSKFWKEGFQTPAKLICVFERIEYCLWKCILSYIQFLCHFSRTRLKRTLLPWARLEIESNYLKFTNVYKMWNLCVFYVLTVCQI